MSTETTSTDRPAPPPPGGSGPDGFDQFFATAWPFAYRLAVLVTHDRVAGEDVAQEVMTRLYAGWTAIERPEAYLRTAIVNTAVNWQRRQTTSRVKLPLVSRPEAVAPVDSDLSAELADALAGLPERQRAVLVLRYWAGLSEAEIADTLGCRPGTVKSLASRALNRLSKELPR